jgi:hypothetical protein
MSKPKFHKDISHLHFEICHLSFKGTSNNSQFVTPAQAEVQLSRELMDSCFRRNDIFRGSLKFYPLSISLEMTIR